MEFVMPNVFTNEWSGGVGRVVGYILFYKLNSFSIFVNRVHWRPLKVEFMMLNVFLNWWSGGVGGVVRDILFEKLNSLQISSIESIGVLCRWSL